MGEKTGITWTGYRMPDGTITEGKTFNKWIGCTKISAGCKLCYAATQNERYKWNPEGWGKGKPRKKTSQAYQQKPFQWARDAKEKGIIYRVFGGSLMDPFDPEVTQEWRDWDDGRSQRQGYLHRDRSERGRKRVRARVLCGKWKAEGEEGGG